MRLSIVASAVAIILPLVTANPINATGVTEQLSKRIADYDIDNAMAVHNWARNVVNVPNLSWDKGLQASAQAYADKLADKVGVLEHSRAGENLFWSSVMGSNDLRDASQSWANEVANYHYEIIPNGDFNGYGHYTQVVWRSTQRVGIGASRDPKGGVYIVAHYDPVGNYVGQRPY